MLHRQKRFSRAEAMYRQALAMQPNNPLVSSNLQELLKGEQLHGPSREEALSADRGARGPKRGRRPTMETEVSLMVSVRPSSRCLVPLPFSSNRSIWLHPRIEAHRARNEADSSLHRLSVLILLDCLSSSCVTGTMRLS